MTGRTLRRRTATPVTRRVLARRVLTLIVVGMAVATSMGVTAPASQAFTRDPYCDQANLSDLECAGYMCGELLQQQYCQTVDACPNLPGVITLPPAEGTLAFLDMLFHDSRQYLMIAAGELESIKEEGTLELDGPATDIEKITIRLKRLKDQCARQARRPPLDWQR